jgi:hypothetical protein
MVGIYRTHEALEAAWKYFILGSVGTLSICLFEDLRRSVPRHKIQFPRDRRQIARCRNSIRATASRVDEFGWHCKEPSKPSFGKPDTRAREYRPCQSFHSSAARKHRP